MLAGVLQTLQLVMQSSFYPASSENLRRMQRLFSPRCSCRFSYRPKVVRASLRASRSRLLSGQFGCLALSSPIVSLLSSSVSSSKERVAGCGGWCARVHTTGGWSGLKGRLRALPSIQASVHTGLDRMDSPIARESSVRNDSAFCGGATTQRLGFACG